MPTTPKQPEKEGNTIAGLDELTDMTESGYSNISSDQSGGDGEDSDCWSVLSTGPVDRQWTVVFEEKDEEL